MRFEKIEHGVVRFSAFVALAGGSGLLFATAVTCLSILMKLIRRLLDTVFGLDYTVANLPWIRSILGEEELVTYGVGFALFAALPWVMIVRGHIKIDLFVGVFSPKLNRLLDLIGDLAFVMLSYLIATRQWFLIFKKTRGSQEPLWELAFHGEFGTILTRLRSAQESQILGIPLLPTYIVAELLVVIFFLVALFCVWRSTRALILCKD